MLMSGPLKYLAVLEHACFETDRVWVVTECPLHPDRGCAAHAFAAAKKVPTAAAGRPPAERERPDAAAAGAAEEADPPVADSPLHVAARAGDAEKARMSPRAHLFLLPCFN